MKKNLLKAALAILIAITIYLLFSRNLVIGPEGETVDAAIAGTKEEEDGEAEAFAKAMEALMAGNQAEAVSFFEMITPKSGYYFDEAEKYLAEIRAAACLQGEEAVRELLSRYQLEMAEALLEEKKELLADEGYEHLEGLISAYRKLYQELEPYEGPIEHVFTHCLIAFPEICYSSPSMMASLDTDCITPNELKAILTALYQNDYILVDINQIYEENEDGSIGLASLHLPKGKKPLVFSVDDVTYDRRKMSTGMVDKLIVDESGKVASFTRHTDGTEVISYENEVFPIVAAFVRKHPDFSFMGARGTLCLTGFDGILGYRVQDGFPGQEQELSAAAGVVAALKEEGWTFASHSYGHGQMDQMPAERINRDILKWEEQVAAIVGETKIFVWPYGASIRSGPGYQQFYQAGFRFFCGVGSDLYLCEENGGIFMDRKALDGYALRNRRERYLHLFDTQAVFDPMRPVRAPK